MTTIHYTTLETPIGPLLISSTDKGLLRIDLPDHGRPISPESLRDIYPDANLLENEERNRDIIHQLEAYFNKTRTEFTLPLDLRGTDFQIAVWRAVAKVPYGATAAYGEIARAIGNPKSVRAVGAANGANPIPIVIPCHRIIGADGSMTGYGGGIPIKIKLLALEKPPDLFNTSH